MSSAYQVHLPYAGDLESPELFDVSKVGCKKSLVYSGHRIDPGHRQWSLSQPCRSTWTGGEWCRQVRLRKSEHRDTTLPLHIFQLASNTHYLMRRTTRDQSMLFMCVLFVGHVFGSVWPSTRIFLLDHRGDSGSGKSENLQLTIETSHSRAPSDGDSHSLAMRRMFMNKASHSSNLGAWDGRSWKGPGPSSPRMIDLLPYHYDLGSDFSHASMWWVMMPLLSVIPSWRPVRFRSL